MSAAAPVHALFEESCGGRVASAGGGVYADWAPPSTITTTTSTTTAPPSSATSPGVKKGKGVEEEDPLLRRFVDAAQELVVPEGELASVKELAFAFQRAASRLVEVRTLGQERMRGSRVVYA